MKILLFSIFLLSPLSVFAATGDKADTNSDYIVIILIFIFLITLLDFLRRIFGQGGNRP